MIHSAHEVGTHQSIYVISGGPKHIKIGISNDVSHRLKTIQTGCPFRVRLVKSWRSPYARKIEVSAHTVLAKYRATGEWFGLPQTVACAVVDGLVRARPRSPDAEPRPIKSIVFCGNCSHHALVSVSPKITTSFRCSKCNHRDRVHVIDF